MDIQYNHEGQKGQIIEKKKEKKKWFIYVAHEQVTLKRKELIEKKPHTHIYIIIRYLKISRHQLEIIIWWSQIEFTGDTLADICAH